MASPSLAEANFLRGQACYAQTIQIWVVTRHLYGISALVSQTSFRGETDGGVAKYRLFPEADKCWLVSLSILKVGMFVTFVYSIKDNPAKNIWN